MVYTVHDNKIVLADDNGRTVAQVDYPDVGNGICEISHIYGEDSEAGRQAAGKLMDMAAREIRKSGRKVIPNCAFAASWFADHPKEADIRATWDMVHQMAGKKTAEKTSGKGRTVNINLGGKKQAKKSLRKMGTDAVKKKARDAALDAAAGVHDTADKVVKGSLKVLTRVLQIICAVLMLFIIIRFVSGAIQKQAFTFTGVSSMICMVLSAAFIVFCVIQLIFIMTRKAMLQDGRVVRKDTGRGITGFIIVLVVYFICGLFINYFYGLPDPISGFANFAGVFQVNGISIMYMAIAGLVLSVIRRVIGR